MCRDTDHGMVAQGGVMKNWGAYLLVGLGYFGYNVMTAADRDQSGAIIGEGSVDAFEMRVGDCFDDTSVLFGSGTEGVNSLPGVPCSKPHDNEVYAVIDVGLPTFPGDDSMSEKAFDDCLARFESFVGRDYDSSSLDIMTLYPSSESWQQDDREIVCALYDMEAEKLEGSAKGSSL